MKENRRSARIGRNIGLTAACAVMLTAVTVFFSACTSKNGGNVDTNTVKETATERVPAATVTQPVTDKVTDNVHDNESDMGSVTEHGSAPSGTDNNGGTAKMPRR